MHRRSALVADNTAHRSYSTRRPKPVPAPPSPHTEKLCLLAHRNIRNLIRKRVPPVASSNLPNDRRVRGKSAFTWPKSSHFEVPSGKELGAVFCFTATSVLAARFESLCRVARRPLSLCRARRYEYIWHPTGRCVHQLETCRIEGAEAMKSGVLRRRNTVLCFGHWSA